MEVFLLSNKYFLTLFLFLCLIYPVYRFIFLIKARRFEKKDFYNEQNKIKKKSLTLAIVITILFSSIYCINFF